MKRKHKRPQISEALKAHYASGRMKLRNPGFGLLGSAKVRGSHQFGCMARGQTDHLHAKVYDIESPNGVKHRVSNLDEWCRNNVTLFPVDKRPCVQPLWQRAANGIRAQAIPALQQTQWRGWRLISIVGKSSE